MQRQHKLQYCNNTRRHISQQCCVDPHESTMFIMSSFSKKDSVITKNFFTRYKTRKKINFKWYYRFGAFCSKMSPSMFQYCPRVDFKTNKPKNNSNKPFMGYPKHLLLLSSFLPPIVCCCCCCCFFFFSLIWNSFIFSYILIKLHLRKKGYSLTLTWI